MAQRIMAVVVLVATLSFGVFAFAPYVHADAYDNLAALNPFQIFPSMEDIRSTARSFDMWLAAHVGPMVSAVPRVVRERIYRTNEFVASVGETLAEPVTQTAERTKRKLETPLARFGTVQGEVRDAALLPASAFLGAVAGFGESVRATVADSLIIPFAGFLRSLSSRS